MGTAFRYSFAVIALLFVIAVMWRTQDISGTYVLRASNAAIMLTLQQGRSGALTGRYNSVVLGNDGKLQIESYAVSGVARGWHLDLVYTDQTLQNLQKTISGDLSGSQLTISYSGSGNEGFSQILARSSQAGFDNQVDILRKRSEDILLAKTAVDEQRKTVSLATDCLIDGLKNISERIYIALKKFTSGKNAQDARDQIHGAENNFNDEYNALSAAIDKLQQSQKSVTSPPQALADKTPPSQ